MDKRDLLDLVIGVAIGLLIVAIALLLILNPLYSKNSCLHPPDATWHIWWAECQAEGYSFHDSYKTWVEATKHGGDLLQMPSNWA